MSPPLELPAVDVLLSPPVVVVVVPEPLLPWSLLELPPAVVLMTGAGVRSPQATAAAAQKPNTDTNRTLSFNDCIL
jgi:hypothetical protein